MLMRPHLPADVTPTPPSPLFTLPNPCYLPSLRSCSTLKMRLQCLPHHSSCFCTPAAYNPYAPSGPSSYSSDTALTPLTPPCTCPILSAAYHPHAHVVPS
ncbi:hypothetical protein O181_079202 [Austropuccinia psidii MF-1]|uniref:Uncharacterized protein n=1 Tax=Austropuccinia psidii MF-1 TaxID=1389203 RepID=A0A9Q3IGA6_9BASI|nr:hypothetical protein [Austropuccinia psidii MF-1]